MVQMVLVFIYRLRDARQPQLRYCSLLNMKVEDVQCRYAGTPDENDAIPCAADMYGGFPHYAVCLGACPLHGDKSAGSLTDKIKSFASSTSGIIRSAVADGEQFRVSDDVYDSRMETCKECPLLAAEGYCKHCNCIMHLKAKFTASSCPLGKWS